MRTFPVFLLGLTFVGPTVPIDAQTSHATSPPLSRYHVRSPETPLVLEPLPVIPPQHPVPGYATLPNEPSGDTIVPCPPPVVSNQPSWMCGPNRHQPEPCWTGILNDSPCDNIHASQALDRTEIFSCKPRRFKRRRPREVAADPSSGYAAFSDCGAEFLSQSVVDRTPSRHGTRWLRRDSLDVCASNNGAELLHRPLNWPCMSKNGVQLFHHKPYLPCPSDKGVQLFHRPVYMPCPSDKGVQLMAHSVFLPCPSPNKPQLQWPPRPIYPIRHKKADRSRPGWLSSVVGGSIFSGGRTSRCANATCTTHLACDHRSDGTHPPCPPCPPEVSCPTGVYYPGAVLDGELIQEAIAVESIADGASTLAGEPTAPVDQPSPYLPNQVVPVQPPPVPPTTSLEASMPPVDPARGR